MNPRRSLATLVFSLGLPAALMSGGCSSIEPGAYRDEKPALSLERYFSGTLDGWGMVQDRSGKVLRRFHVVIDAQWRGDTGTLDEAFTWSDGELQRRVWTLRRQPDGSYTGTAADVVGQARGTLSGNALNWKYVLAVPVDGRVWNLDLDDWMFLVDDRTMLNRAVMRKFGIRVGEITVSFTKR